MGYVSANIIDKNINSRGLEFRYDYPLQKLGKNIEEFLPGELKFRRDDEIIPILALSDAVLDIFEVANKIIYTFYINKKDLELLQDFFNFKGMMFDGFGFEFKPKRYQKRTNIRILKYQIENKVVDIKVFCPIGYENIKSFKESWDIQLKKQQQNRRRR